MKPLERNPIELIPVRIPTDDWDELERQIKAAFYEVVYKPLLKSLGVAKNRITNAPKDLVDAIRSARITYQDGKFSGDFNATISRELKKIGAKWDRKAKAYIVHKINLPADVAAAVQMSFGDFQRQLEKIDEMLQKVLPEEITAKISASAVFDSSIFKVDRNIKRTINKIAVLPEMTDKQRKELANDWGNNMDLFIQDFAKTEIKELRSRVFETAFEGDRRESLIKEIQRSYGVTESKAKFLARQETSLLMTNLKKIRYTSAGINHYRWKCVVGTPAHPVRPMHKALDGKIISWNDPPITSPDGQRNHAGADYNCRCIAIPLVGYK